MYASLFKCIKMKNYYRPWDVLRFWYTLGLNTFYQYCLKIMRFMFHSRRVTQIQDCYETRNLFISYCIHFWHSLPHCKCYNLNLKEWSHSALLYKRFADVDCQQSQVRLPSETMFTRMLDYYRGCAEPSVIRSTPVSMPSNTPIRP